MKTIRNKHAVLKYLGLVCVVSIGLASLLSGHASPVHAQEPQTITATGAMQSSGQALPITVTFPPAGGKVTGIVDYQYEHSLTDVRCLGTVKINLEGTFTGGDGGSLTGTGTGTGEMSCEDGSSIKAEYDGPWSGSFHANGTGGGVWDWQGNLVGLGQGGSDQVPWQVTFSPEEFQGALGTANASDESQPEQPGVAPEAPAEAEAGAITSEYIYNTYGITVEDSMGDAKGTPKSWSDEELVMLNDVLKELPPSFRKHLVLTSIIRNETQLDGHGHPSSTHAAYSLCDRRTGNQECSASTATIRVFDNAFTSVDFANDADGRKQFKATLLHEITHAIEYYKERNAVETDPLAKNQAGYSSPFMQNYMDATRDTTDMNDPHFFEAANGWNLINGHWVHGGSSASNALPTAYAGKNPKEDLSESVKFYVYDPERLKNCSIQRYNFIRDQIFGGVEYEDGHQKQP